MTSFSLRLLALLCMLVDHTGLALFPSASVFRCVGRLAFPLYCFLLVQGYVHTRDVRAYARRLMLWALLSEVPFDLLIFGRTACFMEQNALFTLLLSLLVLCVWDGYRDNPTTRWALLAALMVLAMAARVSYGWLGPALCLGYAAYMDDRRKQALLAVVLPALYCLSLFLSGVNPQWVCVSLCACVAALPILAYNGKRGPAAPLLSALFYSAYPLHLIGLLIVRALRLIPPYFL